MTDIRTEDISTYLLELSQNRDTDRIHTYVQTWNLIYKTHKQTREQKLYRRHKQMHDSTDMRGPHKQIHKLHAYS